jgi:hypothetical protein
MSAERLLRGNVKPPFRALGVFATAAVLAGGSAFAQAPHSVFAPSPFVDRGAEKSRVAEEEGRKKCLVAKSRLGHKKLNCEAGIDS